MKRGPRLATTKLRCLTTSGLDDFYGELRARGGRVLISRSIVDGPDGYVEMETETHAARRIALGDANASMTLDVYSHFLQASDREAADVLGRLIDGG